MLDFPCDLFNKPHVKRHWVRGHHPDDSICKCSTCRSKSLRTPVLCTRNSVFCENLFIPNMLGFPKHSENEGLYYWRRKYQNLFLSALSESVFCCHPGQWQNLKPPTRIVFKFNHFLVPVNVMTFLTELPQIGRRLPASAVLTKKEGSSSPLECTVVFIVLAWDHATGNKRILACSSSLHHGVLMVTFRWTWL